MPQDYSYQNLRGRSFKGQDLTGANFSHSDIRGANFTNAILKNTKFINAKTGLQRRWAGSLVIGSLFLTVLSGLTGSAVGLVIPALVLTALGQPIEVSVFGINVIGVNLFLIYITLPIFYIITIRKGLVEALETVFWAMALIVMLFAFASIVIAIAMVGTASGPSAVAQAWTMGGTVITVGVAALQLAVILIGLAAGLLAVPPARIVVGTVCGTMMVIAAAVVPVIWVLLFLFHLLALGAVVMSLLEVIVGALTWTVAVAALYAYVGWRILAGDEKHAFLWKVAIALAAIGGTKFRGADLTDADFTEATLENTDFRGATLTGICWFQSKRLFSTRF